MHNVTNEEAQCVNEAIEAKQHWCAPAILLLDAVETAGGKLTSPAEDPTPTFNTFGPS